MKTYEPRTGEHILVTAKRICALAKKQKEPVKAIFNDIALVAKPGQKYSSIMDFYWPEVNRRSKYPYK